MVPVYESPAHILRREVRAVLRYHRARDYGPLRAERCAPVEQRPPPGVEHAAPRPPGRSAPALGSAADSESDTGASVHRRKPGGALELADRARREPAADQLRRLLRRAVQLPRGGVVRP